jgi:hypothetical protein
VIKDSSEGKIFSLGDFKIYKKYGFPYKLVRKGGTHSWQKVLFLRVDSRNDTEDREEVLLNVFCRFLVWALLDKGNHLLPEVVYINV